MFVRINKEYLFFSDVACFINWNSHKNSVIMTCMCCQCKLQNITMYIALSITEQARWHHHWVLCNVVCIDQRPNTPWDTWTRPQHISCRTSRYLSDRECIFNGISLIYSDEKYMGITIMPNCTCTPGFNFGHFAVLSRRIVLSVSESHARQPRSDMPITSA